MCVCVCVYVCVCGISLSNARARPCLSSHAHTQNRELRERAGGFTREDQQRRDRDAGLPTLRATLKRRLAL